MDLVEIPCPVCFTCYPSRASIRNHMKKHPDATKAHLNELEETIKILFPENKLELIGFRRGRSYDCFQCEESFMNFSAYRNHICKEINKNMTLGSSKILPTTERDDQCNDVSR